MIRNLYNNIRNRFPAFLCVWTMLLSVLCGCSDEDWNNPSSKGGRSEAILQFDTDVPFGVFRTRADAMGNTDVIKLWVGVYDITTGDRVGMEEYSYPASPISVPILYYDEHPTVVIVGVANYDGVTDWDGTSIGNLLQGAEKWNDFVDINVKVPQVNGLPGVDTDRPAIMMGLLNGPNSPRAFFSKTSNGAVSIENATDYTVEVSKAGEYGMMTKEIVDRKLSLGRLYSQVNVNIVTGSQAEVTNVSFRRCNMPTDVYLAERPTITVPAESWDEYAASTPNFADTKMTVSGDHVTSDEGCYASDGENDWIPANRDNSFSFAHYDNKHWAQKWVDTYDSREQFSDRDRKILNALEKDYNNRASYFVIKMTILDRQLGRSAEVKYVIHEGFINDALGNASSGDKANDFCSFRNMVYNYEITVNGIDYISYNVSNSYAHHDSASGTIWGADITTVNNYIGTVTIQRNQDNVFRFYIGRGNDTAPTDYLNGSGIEDLNGMYWPTIDGNTVIGNVPGEISSRFRIVKGLQTLSVEQFINDARTNGGTYRFTFTPPSTASQWNPDGYKMGFYYYNPGENSNLNGECSRDQCTSYSSKKCHVLEWKPSTRQPQYLNSLSLSNLSATNILNKGVDIDLNAAHANSSNSYRGQYGVDYVYILTFNNVDYTIGDDLKFFIPMSNLSKSNKYYVRAEALNTKELITSTTSSANITLNDPGTFDFTTFEFWDTFFRHHFYPTGTRYKPDKDLEKEYRDGFYICVRKGVEIGLYYEKPQRLYLGSWGDGNGLKFTVYKNCKIQIVTYLTEGGTNLVVDGATPNKISPNVTNQNDVLSPTYVTLNPGEGSRNISVYWEKVPGSFISITITEN